jgi:hypothetical protein
MQSHRTRRYLLMVLLIAALVVLFPLTARSNQELVAFFVPLLSL